MRFALPACKFKELQLCHRFFYDLISLMEPISLNVAKEEIKINHKKDPEGLHSTPSVQTTARWFLLLLLIFQQFLLGFDFVNQDPPPLKSFP